MNKNGSGGASGVILLLRIHGGLYGNIYNNVSHIIIISCKPYYNNIIPAAYHY